MAYEQNPAVWKGGQWGLMLLISDAYEQDFLQFFSFFFLAIRLGNVVNDEYCYWFVMLMNRFVNTWSNFSCYLARKGGEWWLMLLICDAYEQIYLILFFYFPCCLFLFFYALIPRLMPCGLATKHALCINLQCKIIFPFACDLHEYLSEANL